VTAAAERGGLASLVDVGGTNTPFYGRHGLMKHEGSVEQWPPRGNRIVARTCMQTRPSSCGIPWRYVAQRVWLVWGRAMRCGSESGSGGGQP
jgi:hypothetical protein